MDYKTLGNEALQKKDFAKAAEYYTQGIAQDANNHILYSNRASARLALSQFDDALSDSAKSVEINPKWSKGWFRKGQALYGLDRLEESMEALEKAIELEPSDQFKKVLAEVEQKLRSRAQDTMGNLAKQFGSPQIWTTIAANPQLKPFLNDQAFVNNINLIGQNPAMLQPLMQSDPRIMQVLLSMLGLNAQMNPNAQQQDEEMASPPQQQQQQPEPQKPKETPKPAPQPEPVKEEEDAATKEKNLGNDFYLKKQFEKALEHYNKAISLDESNGVFKLNRAAVYLETGKYDECIADCESSVELAKKKHDFKLVAKAYARMGACYAKQEKFEEAIKWYEESITEHRTDDIAKKLYQTKQQKEKKDELAYINPEQAEKERLAGNELFKKNDYPGAVQKYKEAVKRDPKNYVHYSNLGSAYMKLAEYMYALKNFEKAIEIDPKYIKGWARKAQCHFFMKEFHKALDAYEKGLEIEPANAELLEGKAKVQMAIYTSGHDEQRVQQAMKDPEIAQILQDPMMQNILNDMKDPRLQAKHMANPQIAAKIKKLIAAGVLQTR